MKDNYVIKFKKFKKFKSEWENFTNWSRCHHQIPHSFQRFPVYFRSLVVPFHTTLLQSQNLHFVYVYMHLYMVSQFFGICMYGNFNLFWIRVPGNESKRRSFPSPGSKIFLSPCMKLTVYSKAMLCSCWFCWCYFFNSNPDFLVASQCFGSFLILIRRILSLFRFQIFLSISWDRVFRN